MDMENAETTNETTTETEQKTSWTKEEVDALLQSETDRRVTAALKKAEKKKAEAVKEAQKLASMNEEQRFQHELEQREKAIAEKEKQLALAENKAEASKALASRGISAELVDLVVTDDAETMLGRINVLEKAFKASVKSEVEKRLATTTPKKNLPMSGTLTKEQFRKMPLTAQAALSKEQPELYRQLTTH